MQKAKLLYSGKAKSVYETDIPDQFILEFRDDTSAFNGEKLAQLAEKGKINNYFNAFIMEKLAKAGIPTHFVKLYSDTESVVKKLKMIPVECVVRNIAAGNMSKRLGVKEGQPLNPAVFEFFLKDDALGDPMINESHIHTFGWASETEVAEMKRLTFATNEVLKEIFFAAGIQLVDFKLEFGRYNNQLYLGDEFTPDGCRIWDIKTGEKMDKDRFRRDLGNVTEFYRQAAARIGVEIP